MSNPPEIARCPRCGATQPQGATQGLCPTCLVRTGLALLRAENANAESADADAIPAPQPAAAPGLSPAPDSGRPRCFGDYELLSEIAHGGMGVVYRARQRSLNRIVAVKLLLFGRFASESFVKRFHAEAEAAASLHHPNIVAIHEVGEQDGQHYFSMDLVEGRSLDAVVRDKPLSPRTAARYVRILAEAVEYAHRRGILHRDLKPSNVLLDEADQPRITDFGLAKRMADDGNLTLPGQVLGSPNFMPPEQAEPKRGPPGPTVDVYALGAILYHLLTGRPPFLADTIEGTLRLLLDEECAPPRLLNPAVPVDLETICLKCLEKDPARRYATAQALADELDRHLRDEPIHARPAGPLERLRRWCRRKPALAGVTMGLILAIVAGVAAVLQEAQRANQEAGTARKAEAEAREQLRSSELARSRLARFSREAGYRETSLRSVRHAAAIRSGPDLRDEAIAALALPDLAFIPKVSLLQGQSIVFSPTMQWFIRIDHRPELQVCRTDTGAPVATFPAGESRFSMFQPRFSEDERWLGIRLADGSLAIRDWASRQMALQRSGPVQSFEFIPGADEALILHESRLLELVSLTNGLPRWERPLDLALWGLIPSPDGKWFAVQTAQSPELRVYSISQGRRVATLNHAPATVVNTVAWNANATRLAAGLSSGAVAFWETKTWTLQRQAQAHEDAIEYLAFDAGERWMAVLGYGGACEVWPWPDLRSSLRIRGFDNLGQGFFSSNGMQFTWAASNNVAGVVDIQPSRILRRLPLARNKSGAYGAADFSPDGTLLSISSAEGVVLLRFPDGTPLSEDTSQMCFNTLFSPDGHRLFLCRANSLVERTLQATGIPTAPLQVGAPRVLLKPPANSPGLQFRLGALSRDGQWLAVANISGAKVEFISTAQPSNRFSIGPHPNVAQVALNADASRLISSSSADLRLWDVPARTQLRTGPAGAPPAAILSPDNRLVVTGTKSFRVLAVESWKERYRIDGRESMNSGAAFSPDGTLLALVIGRTRIRLVRASNGSPLCTLEAPDGAALSGLAFSPDGRFLTAVEASRSVQVWDLPNLREELARLELDWPP